MMPARLDEDLIADRRRPGEIEILEAMQQCFRDAGKKIIVSVRGETEPVRFCHPGTQEGQYYWSLQLPGDAVVIGGQAFPTHSNWTPCPEHAPTLEHVYRVIRLCPECGENELAPRCRKCEECLK